MPVEFAAMLALLLFSVWGFWLWRKWRDLPDFADTVYEAQREQGLLDETVSKDDFHDVFVNCEAPRSHTYRFGAALLSTVLLPFSVYSFNRIWDCFWVIFGAREGPFERGYLLHTFLTFVFVMAIAVGIIYLMLQHFYARIPPSLKSEIHRLNGDTS